MKGRRGEIARPRSAKHPGDPAIGGQGPVDGVGRLYSTWRASLPDRRERVYQHSRPHPSLEQNLVELTLRRHRTFPRIHTFHHGLQPFSGALTPLPRCREAHILLVGVGRLDLPTAEAESRASRGVVAMSMWRKVCPWDCRGAEGEIDVVRSERALVPDVPAGAAVMRCGTCHGISLASMETMPLGRWAARGRVSDTAGPVRGNAYGCRPRTTSAGSSSLGPKGSAQAVVGRGDGRPQTSSRELPEPLIRLARRPPGHRSPGRHRR